MKKGFNFNSTIGASQSTIKPQLPGNDIYEVTFDGAESTEFEGKATPGTVYKVLRLKFSNELGSFDHTIFEPRDEDYERTSREYTKDGVTTNIESPSNVENIVFLLRHLIDAVLPELSAKIDSGEIEFGSPTWDGLRTNMVKILDQAKSRKTNIKLVTDNKGNARFPGFFTGLSKEGNVYVRNNFIGKALGFTAYEKTRISDQANAKPSNPETFDLSAAPDTSGLDMNFDLGQL